MTVSPQTLSRWLNEQALPLWSTTGIDPATGSSWEALDHAGAPRPDVPRRLRVQARQAYSFAVSGPRYLPLARQLFRYIMDHGFDPETGNLIGTFAPDGSVQTAPHDLYDLAFVILAAAALIEAGEAITADLARIEAELARLKAPRGWYETAAQAADPELGHRRQNPHMHLFEAATALWRATGAERHAAIAQECLDLLRDVFLQSDGILLEFFDASWDPVSPGAQQVEPGHMVEWIYLLDVWEQVSGRRSGVDVLSILAAARRAVDLAGTSLPDRSVPLDNTRRLWPQTEFLKASLVLRRRGLLTTQDRDLPERVLAALWQGYLDTPTPGGWYDKRSMDGALLSDLMPASTFYHIVVALHLYLEQAQEACPA